MTEVKRTSRFLQDGTPICPLENGIGLMLCNHITIVNRYWKRLERVTCPMWVIASPLVAVWCGAALLRNSAQCWADGSINERVQSRILSTPMKYLEAAIISLDLLEFRVSQLSWILLLATKRLLTYFSATFLPGSATLDRRTRDCEYFHIFGKIQKRSRNERVFAWLRIHASRTEESGRVSLPLFCS